MGRGRGPEAGSWAGRGAALGRLFGGEGHCSAGAGVVCTWLSPAALQDRLSCSGSPAGSRLSPFLPSLRVSFVLLCPCP